MAIIMGRPVPGIGFGAAAMPPKFGRMALRRIGQPTDWPNSGNSTGARDAGTSPPSGKRQPCAPQRKHPFGPQHPLRFAESEIQPEKGHFRNTLIFLDFTKNRLAKEDDSEGKHVPKIPNGYPISRAWAPM